MKRLRDVVLMACALVTAGAAVFMVWEYLTLKDAAQDGPAQRSIMDRLSKPKPN